MVNQCLAANRDGNPCSAQPDPGATFCRWHDPNRESEREGWRRKGGANRSNRARARKKIAEQAMSISDIDSLLCSALTNVAIGELESGIGTSMATIARTVVAIRSTGELERRLEELERQAATRMGRIG